MNVLDLIAKLTLDSSDYEQGLQKSKTLAQSVGGGIKTIMTVGTAAVAAAGTAMTAIGADSVKTGMQFDKSMSQVYATMGSKANDMVEYNGKMQKSAEVLRDYALEMGRTTAFSATEAADALNFMALAGYDAETSMKMLPNVLNLAAAGNMDLARASDMVTDTQTAFGISLERTSLMVDEMAKAASTGNTSVEQLGDAFLTVGGLTKELNGGFITLADGTKKQVDGVQELEIALTAMANAGIKGSEAGTHVRNMILKLSKPTKDGAEVMKQLNLSVYDAQGNMRSMNDIMGDLNTSMSNMSQKDKISAISSLFNTYDLSAAEALLGSIEQDWNKIGESILAANEDGVLYQGKLYSISEAQKKFGNDIYDTSKGFEILGAAEVMALKQLDNLEGDMTLFNSALEGTKIAISDKLTPALREFVQFGTKGLSQIADAFTKGGIDSAMEVFGTVLSDGLKMITEKIPEFTKAGIKLLGALGQGIISNIPTITNAATDIVLQLTQAFIDALPELGRGAIELVTALGNSLIENAPQIMEMGLQLLNTLVDGAVEAFTRLPELALNIITTFVDGITQALPTLGTSAISIVEKLLAGLTEGLPKYLDSGKQILDKLIEGIQNNLPTIANIAIKLITMFTQFIVQNAPALITAGIQLLTSLIQGLAQTIPLVIQQIPTLVNGILDVIKSIDWIKVGSDIIEAIGNGIQALIETIPTLLQTICETAISLVESIDWIGLGSAIIDFIVNGITILVENIPKTLEKIGKAAYDIVKNIDWVGLGKKIIDFIVDGLKALIDNVPKKLKEIGEKAFDWFKKIDWIDLGKNIVNKTVDGLKKLFTDIGTKLVELGNYAVGKFKDINWLELGTNVVNGIVNGIAGGVSRVAEAARNLAKGAFDAAKNLLGISSPSKKFKWIGEMTDDGFVEGINSNYHKVEKAMDKLENDTKGMFDSTFSVKTDSGDGSSLNGKNYNSNVIINVYGAQGQDVEELAEIISDKIMDERDRERAWAY